jgi:hypothetical protein
MNKISKAFRALYLIMSNPALLNLIVESQPVMYKKVLSKYGLQNGLPTINLLNLFPEFEEIVEPYTFLEGTSMVTDLAVLKKIALRIKAKNYFEIGTWRGESVANVAQVVEKCFTLNISDEEMKNMKLDDVYISNHRFFSKKLPNVTHLFGHSAKFDFTLFDRKMDMVFVDGDHHYHSVKNDTRIAFKLLKDEKSVIVWHDYSSDTVTIRWDVLAGILDGCPPEKRDNLYHISNTLCAAYIPEKIVSQYLPFNQVPNKVFKVSLQSKKL